MEINSTTTRSNSHKRLVWIDVVKVIAIFLVLWGHFVMYTGPECLGNPVYHFIMSFHMPLFMVMSGFFANKLVDRRLKDVLVSKFLQLILPALVFSIPLWLLNRYFLQTQVSIWNALYYCFWFLKSLFVSICLFYAGFKVFKRSWVGLLVVVVISQWLDFIPHLRFLQLGRMFPCFVLGYVLNNYKELFFKYAKVIAPVCTVGFVLLLSKYDEEIIALSASLSTYYSLGGRMWLLLFYKLLIGIVGSLGVMSIIYILCSKLNGNKMLELLARGGRYTLAIYILQSFLVESLLRHLLSYTTLPCSWSYSVVYAPCFSLIGVVLCLLIYALLEKIRLYWVFDFNHCPIRLWK